MNKEKITVTVVLVLALVCSLGISVRILRPQETQPYQIMEPRAGIWRLGYVQKGQYGRLVYGPDGRNLRLCSFEYHCQEIPYHGPYEFRSEITELYYVKNLVDGAAFYATLESIGE